MTASRSEPLPTASAGAVHGKEKPITHIRPRSGWVAINWRELVEFRELLWVLVARDVMVRYKQTVLGVAWAVLQPLFTMLVFSVVFGRLAKLPSDGVPYPIFVFAGLLPWMFFASSVGTGSSSLLNQQALLTKIYLPRAFVPASAIGGALVDLLISFGVFACLLGWYRFIPTWEVILVLPLILLLCLGALGTSLVLAALTVTYRDIRHVVPFMLQAWLYLSPVIYPVSMVPADWQWVLALNPMTGIIDAFRSALLDRPWNFQTLAVSAIASLLLLVYGMFYFRRVERRFADIA